MAQSTTGTIVFELVSPEKLVVSEPVEMVVVPGSEGLFGVLKGHAPLIAMLKPGVIDVHGTMNTVTRRIFVGDGFAEVTPERCVVLAETAVPVDQLDRAKIVDRIQSLENVADLAMSSGGDAEHGILAELAMNRAMLHAIDDKPV